MAEPVMLRVRLESSEGTLAIDGPLALWQVWLASLGRAPALPEPPPEDDPEAVQPDEL